MIPNKREKKYNNYQNNFIMNKEFKAYLECMKPVYN